MSDSISLQSLLDIKKELDDLNLSERQKVAALLGFNVEDVTATTVFIIYGQPDPDLPNFVRRSMVIDEGRAYMMEKPDIEFTGVTH